MEQPMTIDDISCNWEEDGELRVEQLDKFVLSKGAWSTIMFLYRERQPDGSWSGNKARIQRYKKIRGRFSSQSKFNISSAKQAIKIRDQLASWFPDEE